MKKCSAGGRESRASIAGSVRSGFAPEGPEITVQSTSVLPARDGNGMSLEELAARERVGLALELVSLPQGRNKGKKRGSVSSAKPSVVVGCGVCARM